MKQFYLSNSNMCPLTINIVEDNIL